MITLRHHLISLIAVFLALGLGVVAGSTFISPVTVRALQGSINALDTRDSALEQQNGKLAQENVGLSVFATASRDLMVRNVLSGRPTVILAFDTTPSDETSQVETTLVEAGARVQGLVVLSSNLGLADDASRQQVALALAVSATPPDALQVTLIRQLGQALDGTSPGVFQRLAAGGLAKLQSVPAQVSPSDIAVPGSAVVILAPLGPQGSPKAQPDIGRGLILPLVRSLGSVLTVVGEDGTNPLPVLTPIRQDSAVKVVTVDGADTPMGQAAIVLGLVEAANGGVHGDYGSGPGARSLLPGSGSGPSPSPSVTGSAKGP